MRKIINAAGQEFVPVSTDDLVLDAVPTVNSFNSVTSDAVARAVAGASGEVPQVTDSDNGKVLTAVYDAGGPAVEWGAAPSGLPDTTGASQGDVLTVGSTGPEWAGVPSELPDSTGASQGDVLTVGSSGLEWAGVPAELPPTTGASQGDVLSIGSSGIEWATPSSGGGGFTETLVEYLKFDQSVYAAGTGNINLTSIEGEIDLTDSLILGKITVTASSNVTSPVYVTLRKGSSAPYTTVATTSIFPKNGTYDYWVLFRIKGALSTLDVVNLHIENTGETAVTIEGGNPSDGVDATRFYLLG